MKTNKKYSVLSQKIMNGIILDAIFQSHFDTLAEAQTELERYNNYPEQPGAPITFNNRILLSTTNDDGNIIEVQELPKKGRA